MKKLLILVTFLGLTVHFCDVQGSAQSVQKELDLELLEVVKGWTVGGVGLEPKDKALEKIRALLKAGANVNAVTHDGMTVLTNAIRYHASHYAVAVVDLLLEKGADVNAAATQGWTPLMFAVVEEVLHGKYTDKHAIIELLLEKGANVNAVNERGDTALLLTVKVRDVGSSKHLDDLNRYAIAELLLDKGAKVNVVDKNGATVLGQAGIGDFYKTYSLLRKQYEHELESARNNARSKSQLSVN